MAHEQLVNLADHHRDFIEFVLTPRSERPADMVTEKQWAEAHGFHPASLRNWKGSKVFKEAWSKRADELNVDVGRTQEVLNALYTKAVEEGDVKAMTAYLAYVERHTPKMAPKSAEAELKELSEEELEALIARGAADELAERRSRRPA